MASDNYVISDEVWPPGFRFHPTDEELVLYYLKRKICCRRLKLDVLAQIDVYKHEPEELPGLSLLKNGDRQWFFFSPRDRKYPNGSRSNRATKYGYWKATGKDRTITCNSRNVGLKKTLVFYRGRAPSGARTDWVMHEYTLDEDELKRCPNAQDCYALYKVFKKSGPGPKNGEHYGAPFREEDWVDYDCRAITCNNDHTDLAVHSINAVVDSSCKETEVDPFFDNIGEFMNRLLPEPTPQPLNVDYFEKALSEFIGEEELGEATYAEEPCTTYIANSQQNGFATTCGLETWDASDVTSNNAITFNLPPIASQQDFVEMNDILYANIGVLPDSDPMPQEGGWVPQVGFGDELWGFDPNTFLTTTIPSNRGSVPLPPSGFVGIGNMDTESIQKQQSAKDQHFEGGVQTQTPTQSQNQDQNQPWLSSTLWSFVESIPAAPAEAAESAFANKAFQRMSSFNRVRISTKSTTLTARGTTSASTSHHAGGRIKGFFLFSLLVAFFAVVCVFAGSKSSVKLRSL